MTTISLGILTKNADDQLEPLLEQCAPYAYEIIIIDGFSTDGTLDIAKKYNAKIYQRAFTGSFADLRNELLSLSNGEYMLMLDADETLEDASGLFNKTYTDNAYALPRHNFVDYVDMADTYPDYQTRLIKCNAGITYSRDVHEVINGHVSPLNVHIIHDKHSSTAGIKYDALSSAIKARTSRWIEYIDVMNTAAYGVYDAELFANGDMARWFSNDASIVFTCNVPEASELEIKISTFGVYENVTLELFTFSNAKNFVQSSLGKLENITRAGTYHIPLNADIIGAPMQVKLVVTGINAIGDTSGPRDLCIFVDHLAFTSNYVNGVLKLLWDESDKYLMRGFTYDEAIMACIRASGWWETDNLSWMNKLIHKDDVCLDIGANIGSLTIPMSTLCNNVYAFEAGFEIFGMLKSNLLANNIKNVTPLYNAISNKKEIVYFHHNRHNVGGSYVTAVADNYATSAVQAIRLDTWAKDNLKKLNFIKCDIEGFEVKFLRGAKQTLKKYQPLLMIEFNPTAYSNNSVDDTVDDLWKELTNVYSHIYVIEGPDTLRLVNSVEEASLRIDGIKRTLEDLLCSTSEL